MALLYSSAMPSSFSKHHRFLASPEEPHPSSLQPKSISSLMTKLSKPKAKLIASPAIPAAAPSTSPAETKAYATPKKPRILIAGGGIGGLVLALAARKKGFEVIVFERDVSAIRGEGQYRGPIQIQSNALATLEAIDMGVAEEVMRAGCVTGDRINGLVDGISGSW
jgi:zeaxanthin epoxidase